MINKNIFMLLLVPVLIFSAIAFKSVNDNTTTTETEISDDEHTTTYDISADGGKIIAYNSVPQHTIDFLKDYIIDNGYNDKDIYFDFDNGRSYNTDSQTYHISELYNPESYNKDISIGYISIDGDDNVIETENLMNITQLSEIQMSPQIASGDVVSIAKEYLGLDDSVRISQIGKILYRELSEPILCYRIKFEEKPVDLSIAPKELYTIYIDGITGDVVSVEDLSNDTIDDSV